MSRPKKTVIEYRNYELPETFPILLLTGERWRISDIKSGRLHFHNCLEIGLCHTDSGIMEFEDTPFPFRALDVTCVSRNVPHTTYSAPGTASRWSYLFFAPEELLHNYAQTALPDTRVFTQMLQNFRRIMPQEDFPQVHELVTAIIRELAAKKAHYKISVQGLCLALLIELLRAYTAETASEKFHSPENALAIAPALEYINANYSQQFPVEFLAELCQISPSHFRRLFRSIMRCSPLQFIHNTRISQSCILLRSTEASILAVSGQVGFPTVSSYNRLFLTLMGMAPAEWRRRMAPTKKSVIEEYRGWMEPDRFGAPRLEDE